MKGLSFGQIAAELCKLGRKISRNSVIGRSKRIGLPPRPKAGNKNPKPKGAHGGKRFVFGCGLAKVAPRKPAIEDKPTPSLAGPFLGLSLIELAAEHCHYPEGEGAGITFCGQPITREDSSYCAAHHDFCHVRSRV